MGGWRFFFRFVCLHSHDSFDVWVWVVIFQTEVFVLELEYIFHFGVDVHLRQVSRFPFQLQFHLFEVVRVDVCVSKSVYEVSGFQSRHLCHHHEQQGVGCDVEGDSEEAVCAPLVELQAQSSVSHIELEEGVTGWQVHVFQVCDVPCVDDDASRVRIILDGFHGFCYLVYVSAFIVGP